MNALPGANYSRLDRLLHRMAFSGIEIQKSLADIEDRIHATRLAEIPIDRPVFITGLPRAGTTVLLNLVTRHPAFATHTYRCMPFVLCPMLWDSVSRGFRRESELKERAHGDGVAVGYDSPEAFEEVLWKAFFGSKYREDRIELWRETDIDREFEEFFVSHLRKLMALHGTPGARYVSKNNANVARLPVLGRMFPDAVFLVPFRDPVDQAGSFLRQHQRFVKLHAEDPFTRIYMDSIGHYEFGAELKPIAFPVVQEPAASNDPLKGDFWLSYWMRAYTYLLQRQDQRLHFVDFDGLCADPLRAIGAIVRTIGAPDAIAELEGEAADFHPAVRYDATALGLDPVAVERARSVQTQLVARAIR